MKDFVDSLVLVTGAVEGGGPWGGNGVWAYRRDGVGEGQTTEDRPSYAQALRRASDGLKRAVDPSSPGRLRRAGRGL